MRLFLYGTLLSPARLARHAGPGLTPTPATLRAHRRVHLRGTPYPTLTPAFRAHTTGAIVDVPAQALRRLKAYEGDRYRLTRVAVTTARGQTAAFAWIAPAATRRPWP
jgi:gamma-glutamylcyclotransferase (GGCT)/AIG2-like uncharacterized protein YtfP